MGGARILGSFSAGGYGHGLYLPAALGDSPLRLSRLAGRLSARRIAAFYLLFFLGAAAISPHQHLNSLEDLISDGPSDSGAVLATRGPQSPTGHQWSAARLLDDGPCLACFSHDFDSATEVIAVFALAFRFSSLSLVAAPLNRAMPPQPRPPLGSRAPPPPASL